ncbi:unnamed protein product [Psylliodes chrysocephalus]|uniref:Cytochrome P450 n=1 Tax=Psylliodes chrysocephalus TaxID=3402493 RepID=A0A9P0G4Q6_9CUCU|nr:unnamed protein product [Psylliodes chrysocephala]
MDYYLGYILAILTSVLTVIKNYIRTVILVWKLPGPPALPLLGNVLIIKNNEELIYVSTYASILFGPLIRIWVSLLPVIVIYEPRHLKLILSTNKNNEKGFFYKALHNFIGPGLITSNGYTWKKNRKLIQPYFHMNVLEKFIEHFVECSHRFVSKLDGQKTLKITPFINDCILDVLHNSVLGVPLDLDSPYRKGELQAIERFIRPWLIFEPIYSWTSSANYEKKQKSSLESYTKQILYDRKKELKNSTKTCFLDMFIEISENNDQFTEEDIINETITFMLAGQDSVAGTMAFTLFYLAKEPEIQDKLIKEMSDYDVNSHISMKEINQMKYMEQVIKESLRLIPVIPLISRVITEDITLDKTVIPAGTNLFVSPFVTHRLEEFYPDPLKFDPDRFEESRVAKMHPYSYLPFSLGPRNCIGYKFSIIELKILLFYFLKKYVISLPPGKEEVQISYRATIRASGGIWLTLTPRT